MLLTVISVKVSFAVDAFSIFLLPFHRNRFAAYLAIVAEDPCSWQFYLLKFSLASLPVLAGLQFVAAKIIKAFTESAEASRICNYLSHRIEFILYNPYGISFS